MTVCVTRFWSTLALLSVLILGAAPVHARCVECEDSDTPRSRPTDNHLIPNLFRRDNPIISTLRSSWGGETTGTVSSATEGELPPVAAIEVPRLRNWVEFSHTAVESDQTNAKYGSRALGLTSGLEYTLSNGMIVAAALAREDLDVDTPGVVGGNLDGKGYTFAPYFKASFQEHWQVSVMAGYSWLDFDVRAQPDDFKARRVFASAGLVGQYEIGNGIRLSPEVYGWYAEQATDHYTNSLAARFPRDRSDFGRVSFGGEIGYPIQLSSGRVEPYVRVLGEADFDDDDRTTLSTGQTFSRDDFGVVAGAGMNANLGDRIKGRFEGTWDSIGRKDIDAFTVRGRVEVQF